MNEVKTRSNLFSNTLTIINTILLVVVITQGYFFSSVTASNKPPVRVQPTIGKKVNLPDVDFAQQPKTVVLGLQTSCHFCNESAPFYKKMLEEAKGKNIKFVAVFPTPVADSEKHLAELGITGFEVKQAPVSTLDASGTPTLIITNSKGEVEKFWVGKLPANKESEVMNQINS